MLRGGVFRKKMKRSKKQAFERIQKTEFCILRLLFIKLLRGWPNRLGGSLLTWEFRWSRSAGHPGGRSTGCCRPGRSQNRGRSALYPRWLAGEGRDTKDKIESFDALKTCGWECSYHGKLVGKVLHESILRNPGIALILDPILTVEPPPLLGEVPTERHRL